jgi:cytochrome P450
VSQYVTTTQNLPKSPLETSYIEQFLGVNNMVTLEGHRWKAVRSMFNPGFSSANLMTMTDYIVDSALTFCSVMRQKAEANELFELEEYTTRLTIDIIGKLVLDVDLETQKRTHPIVQYFRERVLLMPPPGAGAPWQGVDLLRPLKLWWNARKLDGSINRELDLKIQRRAQELEGGEGTTRRKKRSVLDLALDAYEKEMMLSDQTGSQQPGTNSRITSPSQLPSGLRIDVVDQLKAFIFAGHDTTSSTLSYTFYLLHRYPEAHGKLKAELDAFFPPGTSASERIKQEPHVLNKLEYTSSVIKETLRLFPAASTVRYFDSKRPAAHAFVTDPRTKQRYPISDCAIWPVVHLIHRNKRFFPQPTHFIPERFIPSRTPFPDAELFTDAGKDAFRPFEKGPRNCIGQELAMLEARIILALTVRELDFVVEYPGEEADLQYPTPESTAEEMGEGTEYGRALREGRAKKDHVEGHRMYQTLMGAAKPVGRSPGRMKLRVV